MISLYVYIFIILPIVCEAITEIIGDSVLFEPLRKVIRGMDITFFNELLECKYCLSVWVAVIVGAVFFVLFGEYTISAVIFIVISSILIHRLSNVYHLCFDILRQLKIKAEINRSTVFITTEE